MKKSVYWCRPGVGATKSNFTFVFCCSERRLMEMSELDFGSPTTSHQPSSLRCKKRELLRWREGGGGGERRNSLLPIRISKLKRAAHLREEWSHDGAGGFIFSLEVHDDDNGASAGRRIRKKTLRRARG